MEEENDSDSDSFDLRLEGDPNYQDDYDREEADSDTMNPRGTLRLRQRCIRCSAAATRYCVTCGQLYCRSCR
jgi:late competence protein required for DNA uptake (superfamily II DNA/RNA helicase)